MQFHYHRVYEIAELMTRIVDGDYDSFDELDWESIDVEKSILRFSKTSLLGHFCYQQLTVYERRRFRRDPETVDIESVMQAFHRYAIPFKSFRQFVSGDLCQDQDEQDTLHLWLIDQEEAFQSLWERMTDEVVHLLFGNRNFLLSFNKKLAEYRTRRGDQPSPRCSVPAWVKKAVYFRENGKCALCKTDLSGLIALDSKQHYDHMVPLKYLGANDPCNIQLLCGRCNLLKGASPGRTSILYDTWWPV